MFPASLINVWWRFFRKGMIVFRSRLFSQFLRSYRRWGHVPTTRIIPAENPVIPVDTLSKVVG